MKSLAMVRRRMAEAVREAADERIASYEGIVLMETHISISF